MTPPLRRPPSIPLDLAAKCEAVAVGAKQAEIDRLRTALVIARDAMVNRPVDSDLFRSAIAEVNAALGSDGEEPDA